MSRVTRRYLDRASGRKLRPPGIARGVPAWLWVAWCAVLTTVTFFRDPGRRPNADLVAPADGRVTVVDRIGDGRWRIATYMSLRDVHVNRAPLGGVVRSIEHRPGRHLPAFDKDSDRNERMRWTIDTARGELEVIQIAGALARRIVPYRAPGDTIRCGERIGLIRFGSRVDVLLPPGLTPTVAVGDRLRAGESRLAA